MKSLIFSFALGIYIAELKDFFFFFLEQESYGIYRMPIGVVEALLAFSLLGQIYLNTKVGSNPVFDVVVGQDDKHG